MTIYSFAEAERNLCELIDRALKGERVVISRDGVPVVELKAAPRPVTEVSPAM
jgi:antitoxin (DNA-binding transcriptional repressor) of toxin-antitoxin stability system